MERGTTRGGDGVIDFIHPLLAIPVGFAALVAYFVLEVRAAKPGPDDLSVLDKLDGLDSRTG